MKKYINPSLVSKAMFRNDWPHNHNQKWVLWRER